jgi:hypothetical protein
VPGFGDLHRLPALVVLGQAVLGFHLTTGAAREVRAVLAAQEECVWRSLLETFGIEVAAARDAVNVMPVVGVRVALGVQFLPLALGESLFSLSHAPVSFGCSVD